MVSLDPYSLPKGSMFFKGIFHESVLVRKLYPRVILALVHKFVTVGKLQIPLKILSPQKHLSMWTIPAESWTLCKLLHRLIGSS